MTKGYKIEAPSNPPQEGDVYKHYKGDSYEIIGIAIHSNEDIWMVVYKPLYENADAEYFTRPLTDWREKVIWEGKEVGRFQKQ
jgi:hypothetical protein